MTVERQHTTPRSLRVGAPRSRSISVVVSTYEWPEALDAVLRGLAAQSDAGFEIVVADDGSTPSTRETVECWRAVLGQRLEYVRQPDEGFRLARVRNLGAAFARGDYLVFIDGDCIPRRHFVAAVRRAGLSGWFLASKRLELSERLSKAVLRDRTAIGSWSAVMLLARARRDVRGWRSLSSRDRRRPWRPALPDFVPQGNAYGFCMCIDRADFEAVDGFDTRFVGWGEQDVDLATRLRRLGIRSGFAGPSSTLLHLWHPSHMSVDRPTWWLLQETIASDRVAAGVGFRELVSSLSTSDRQWQSR